MRQGPLIGGGTQDPREPHKNILAQINKKTSPLPRVPPERGVVERVEAVVVGDHDVCAPLQQQRQHVVTLLGDGVVQRGVALGILQKRKRK